MRNKVVMFDLDGVLADFVGGYSRLYEGIHGHSPGPFRQWNDLLDTEVWGCIEASTTFWQDLNVLQGVRWPRVNEATKGCDVYFVTNRVGKDVKQQSEVWLSKYIVGCPTVIVTAHKGEVALAIGANYSIDDKAGNAVYISYHSPGTNSYLLDNLYNQYPQQVLGSRVKRVTMLESFLRDAEEGK